MLSNVTGVMTEKSNAEKLKAQRRPRFSTLFAPLLRYSLLVISKSSWQVGLGSIGWRSAGRALQ